MRSEDCFRILEVPRTASAKEIRDAYKILVKVWHPDRFPEPAMKLKANQKLAAINEAYRVLRDSGLSGVDDYESAPRPAGSPDTKEAAAPPPPPENEPPPRATRSEHEKEPEVRVTGGEFAGLITGAWMLASDGIAELLSDGAGRASRSGWVLFACIAAAITVRLFGARFPKNETRLWQLLLPAAGLVLAIAFSLGGY